jgi:hypothetical protein
MSISIMASKTSLSRLRLTVLLLGAISARAQDADCDATTISAAESQYEIGRFDRSVDELRQCLPDGFGQKEQRLSAYRLMALNYIVTDSLDQARQSIRLLLKTDSGFEPDPDNDPPLFSEMVQNQKPPWYTFMWEGSSTGRWVGRVAVVGMAVAVPFLLRDTSPEPLPGPPDLPSSGAP